MPGDFVGLLNTPQGRLPGMTFTVFLPSQQDEYGDEDIYDFLHGGVLKVHSDTRFQPAGTAVYYAPGKWDLVGAGEGHDPGAPKPIFIPDPTEISG
jgi:hypothetical protein